MGNPRGLRIALPVLVILPLVWLMIGCVYIPWFEQATFTGTRRDFRRLPAPPGAEPLAVGRVSAAQVLAVLGEPKYRSANSRVFVYTLQTSHGVWIEPLCFHVTPGGRYAYALALRFDAGGVLEHRRLVTVGISPVIGPYLGAMGPDPEGAEAADSVRAALIEIDRDNGVSHDRKDDPAGQQGWSVARETPQRW